jgi:leader peptidase (prepilin peptidase)/N-methyltransferase
MLFIEYLQQNSALFLLAVALLGLAVGSFLNVVVHRLPIMMEREWKGECRELLELPERNDQTQDSFNLIRPRSRCPHCGHRITALENIPILSYLVLRGRCSSCGASISFRYPMVELATALFSIVVAWRFGFGWETAAMLPLTWALIALSLIDFDRKLLPDSIIFPFLWGGLILSLFGVFADGPESAIIGAAAGYLSLWSVFQLFKLLTGKEGMGYGDFKLLALFGAWHGWQYLIFTILISSLVGAVIGILLVLFRGHDRSTPIPFGPYLATAGWISLLWGEEINRTYLQIAGLT